MPRRELPTTHTRITAENERKLKRRVSAQTFVGGDTYGPYDPDYGAQYFEVSVVDGFFDYTHEGYYFTNNGSPDPYRLYGNTYFQGTAFSYEETEDQVGVITFNVDGLYWVEVEVGCGAGDLVDGDYAEVEFTYHNATALLGTQGWSGGSVTSWMRGGPSAGGNEPKTVNFGKTGAFRAGSQFSFHISRAIADDAHNMSFRALGTLLGAGTVL